MAQHSMIESGQTWVYMESTSMLTELGHRAELHLTNECRHSSSSIMFWLLLLNAHSPRPGRQCCATFVQICLSSQCTVGTINPELYRSGQVALSIGVEAGPRMTPECAVVSSLSLSQPTSLTCCSFAMTNLPPTNPHTILLHNLCIYLVPKQNCGTAILASNPVDQWCISQRAAYCPHQACEVALHQVYTCQIAT